MLKIARVANSILNAHNLIRYLTILIFFVLSEITQAHTLKNSVLQDYASYYCGQGMPYLISGLSIAGTLANTNLDSHLQSYWQQHIRSGLTNKISDPINAYGKIAQWKVALPIYLASMVLEDPTWRLWGNHSLRTLLLGAPQQLLLTHLLGGGRPPYQSSYWHWFKHDRAVSGHAFYGAIPFLNLAQQHSEPLIKATLYALSILPAFARFNQDKHYASQAFLGWWLAFSATRVVWDKNIVSKKSQWTYHLIPSTNAIYLGVIAKL